MSDIPPQFVVIAGPNGAGKSTSAPALLPTGVKYINADEIAKGLSGNGRNNEMLAGRMLLDEWDRLEAVRANFAIETTLASKSLAVRIRRLQNTGYKFHLVFFWLPEAEFAIERVAERVRQGGHNIPELTIRRRYLAGLSNFFTIYQPIADSWQILDSRSIGVTRPIAAGSRDTVWQILDETSWDKMKRGQP